MTQAYAITTQASGYLHSFTDKDNTDLNRTKELKQKERARHTSFQKTMCPPDFYPKNSH